MYFFSVGLHATDVTWCSKDATYQDNETEPFLILYRNTHTDKY